MPSSRKELQGPRPPPLKVNKDSWKVKKPSQVSMAATTATTKGNDHEKLHDHRKNPVIVYQHTPKIIHARPQDFMSLVQSLTGKHSLSASLSNPEYSSNYGHDENDGMLASHVVNNQMNKQGADDHDEDPLLLTLGSASTSSMPSPISPSLFFCSPGTLRLVQDLLH